MLLLIAGSVSGAFALVETASIVMGLVLAVVPVRPVVALSVGLSVAFTLVAVGLTALQPSVSSLTARVCNAVAVYFSSHAFRQPPSHA